LPDVFLADERGAVSEGRVIRNQLLAATSLAFRSLAVDGARVTRALRQYERGLRVWFVGGELLALSQLRMAVENRTDASSDR
jgi:hypothetical protein